MTKLPGISDGFADIEAEHAEFELRDPTDSDVKAPNTPHNR